MRKRVAQVLNPAAPPFCVRQAIEQSNLRSHAKSSSCHAQTRLRARVMPLASTTEGRSNWQSTIWIIENAACDEQPADGNGWEPPREHHLRRDEVRAGREHVIDERNHRRRRLRERFIDDEVRDELRDAGTLGGEVRGRHARRAEKQFADVELAFEVHSAEHLEHPVVVEGIVLRLGGRHRDERDTTQRREVYGVAKLAGDLLNRALLVTPLGFSAPVGRLLQVQDEVIRLTAGVAAPRRVLPEEVALVGGGEVWVERTEEVIDCDEHPGPPAPRRGRGRGQHRAPRRTHAASVRQDRGSSGRG